MKFQLFESGLELIEQGRDRMLARGLVERIGSEEGAVAFEIPGKAKRKFAKPIPNHEEAIATAFACLTDAGDGLIHDLAEIRGVGHRMVHAGEHYAHSVLIDRDVVKRIEECVPLAPLHNPHNLKGYYAVRSMLPHCPNVAVFDTAFHQTMPAHAYLYGLPYECYTLDKIRRYGFHGTSHQYVCQRFAELQASAAFRLITCHLGSGASMCAVDRGRSVDTTLGFTPLEGLVMGTRSGDLDPGALLHLMGSRELSVEQASALLNNRSGLLGLSGSTNDMRELIDESRGGNERARLAIGVFCYRVRKYIGAYYAVLNGADAVIFTGGIGENAPLVRAGCCESLEALGIRLDAEKNERASGREMEISAGGARTAVWVIPTNEELLIARDTVHCIQFR